MINNNDIYHINYYFLDEIIKFQIFLKIYYQEYY